MAIEYCTVHTIFVIPLRVFTDNVFFSQAFLDACKTGDVGVVLELLECGVDPNQADKVREILSTVPICLLVDDIVSTGWCNFCSLGQCLWT